LYGKQSNDPTNGMILKFSSQNLRSCSPHSVKDIGMIRQSRLRFEVLLAEVADVVVVH